MLLDGASIAGGQMLFRVDLEDTRGHRTQDLAGPPHAPLQVSTRVR